MVDSEGSFDTRGKRVLNLGSGAKKLRGAVNLDVTDRTAPDIVHDLNVLPWPFSTRSFDEVHAYDVLEHVDDVVAFMEELHRICSPEAIVHITVPHFSCANAWRDPTHRRAFAHDSISYFEDGHPLAFYSAARFHVVCKRIEFVKTPVNRVIARLANRWPSAYENRWAWMFPAWFLYWQLRPSKPPPAR
jgi:SAM-dependent methyltransferase